MGLVEKLRSQHLWACLILVLLPGYTEALSPVTVEGSTALPALPNAEITVYHGTETPSTTVANDSGRFSAQFESISSDDLVRIQACGVGDQDHICYFRLIHTDKHITDNSDSNDVFRTGPISPVSTIAYASLVKFGLDGQEPETWNDIGHLVRGLQVYSLFHDAATLFHLSQSADNMPAGFSNLLELSLNEQALKDAVNAFDPEQRMVIYEGLISKPYLFLVPEGQFPVDSTLMVQNSDGSTANSAYSIELENDQSGQFSTRGGSGLVTWENMATGDLIFADDMDFFGVNERYIAMLPAEGDSIMPPISSYIIPDGYTDSVELVQKTLQADWRMVNASEAIPISLLSTREETTAPDNPELSPDDVPALGTTTSHSVLTTKTFDAAPVTWSGPAEGTSWAFPRCDPDCESDAGVVGAPNLDIIDFESGGNASARISGEALEWASTGNEYTITHGDGISVEVIPLGASSFEFGDLETTQVVTRGILPDGQIKTTSHNILQADDPTPTLADEEIPGRYRLMSPILSGSYLQLNLDGTGWSAILDDPNDPRPDEGGYDFEWEILESGDLLLKLLPRGSSFVQATFTLLPANQTPEGLYGIGRLGFGAEPAVDSAGTLFFLESVPEP
ncbi:MULTISPECIES: hypothetical protein [unclassified Wenzhouxiangella]|uniref:hypothetical protein n=1 Tax=unclassified Wenzhouxiangella TaxID=2613841 RepID=UPI000E32B8C5|nr:MULTISPECIES: hypothetical protein [unclassified Wenzhouxiangella]RFF29002.1 hypothetical protein DZK25_00435 [Wenzhouxiangella sp. 15181]RFP68292.1 hypothetical protein DZK26_08620 [Wenzhouxiangella sp. 15190]